MHIHMHMYIYLSIYIHIYVSGHLETNETWAKQLDGHLHGHTPWIPKVFEGKLPKMTRLLGVCWCISMNQHTWRINQHT